MSYKKCFVPTCLSNGRSTPNKTFIYVRDNLKESWCQKLNIKYEANRQYYCCEDHLNLEEDLENYQYWKLMKGRPSLKPTASLRLTTFVDVKVEPADPLCSNSPDETQSMSSVQPKMEPAENDVPSELQKLLMATVPVKPKEPIKNVENISRPPYPRCSVGVQCKPKTAVKSTNYNARKLAPLMRLVPKPTADPSKRCSRLSSVEGSVDEEDDRRCKECGFAIKGYQWWCVQCSCMRCGACVQRAAHRTHFILRVPVGSVDNQTQAAIASIKHHLVNLSEQQYNMVEDDEDVANGLHHKFCDTDADPHNSTRGFFYSHIGWMLVEQHPEMLKKEESIDLSDLTHNPVLQFQKKYYVIISRSLVFILPAIIPIIFWQETLKNSHFVSLLRLVVGSHMFYLINSAAHMFGYKPYNSNISSTQSSSLSLVAFGEGFHNYHHVFPFDYKVAELGNNYLNSSTKFIDFFSWVGWAYDLKQASDDMVMKTTERVGDGTDLWGRTKEHS